MLPIKIPKIQFIDLNIPKHSHINTQLLSITKINKNRTPTIPTKPMRNSLMPKLITFQRLIALMPFDLVGFGIDEQIAILGADGTVATVDLVR